MLYGARQLLKECSVVPEPRPLIGHAIRFWLTRRRQLTEGAPYLVIVLLTFEDRRVVVVS